MDHLETGTFEPYSINMAPWMQALLPDGSSIVSQSVLQESTPSPSRPTIPGSHPASHSRLGWLRSVAFGFLGCGDPWMFADPREWEKRDCGTAQSPRMRRSFAASRTRR